jgi:hypothetical protein
MEKKEYIERGALIEWLKSCKNACIEVCKGLINNIEEYAAENVIAAYYDCIGYVESVPAADVVEVVRCKDCKRRGDPDKCPMCYEVPVYQCNGEDSDGELCWDVWEEIEDRTIDDSFCSCGERRADNG